MKPLIFLDIDDVIATNPEYSGLEVASYFRGEGHIEADELWSRLFLPESVSNLLSLHEEFLPNYVITSSWTNYLSQPQIQYAFAMTGLDFVGKNLHQQWMTPKNETFGRLSEIQAWIAKYHQNAQPILIIDDAESGWNLRNSEFDLNRQVIFCEPRIGFTELRLNQAKQILVSK